MNTINDGNGRGGVRPPIEELLDIASTGRFRPVLELAAPNGEARYVVTELAAVLNCIASDERPCDRCFGCRDARSSDGLAIRWIEANALTVSILGKLSRDLMSQPPVRWQFVVINGVQRIRGRATKDALETMLRNPVGETTFVLVTTGDAALG